MAHCLELVSENMLSILHISDLHRSPDDPVANENLLASLVDDRERYAGESPRIPPPEAIVVSGDLIGGARIGAHNWENSIEEQYKVAFSFLDDLCRRFLDGDRRRMILIPGNHDVCWNTSFRAMQPVSTTHYPTDVYTALTQPNSPYRWCWSKRRLFQIIDQDTYEQRMDRYWTSLHSFYKGVDLHFPLDRSRGFQLFELCKRRIIVATFDSINGNDCFRFSGSLAPGAVGKCATELRDAGHSYDLKVAVWHHSIKGPPLQSDYMDASHVHQMIGHGFQLGLHGHQHVASTLTQHVHLDASHAMAVVSAGSLCADASQLPRGENRQYNLIVVEDDFLGARVDVREMGDGDQFTRKRTGEFITGFAEVSWQPQTNISGMATDAQEMNLDHSVELAEVLLNSGDFAKALEMLKEVDVGSRPHARKLKIQALLSARRWSELIDVIGTPLTVEEKATLIESLIQTDRFDDAQRRLSEDDELDATLRADLQERLEVRALMMKS